ncbi:hypothetical protein HV173_20330 [Citrobacter freundii]|nr:hypothetical protein [Citrobacter freundii]QLO05705.1 hypothetical protein HV141_20250 [Citrobacter freundii]QLU68378.1 hypothetical protein HV173_20330 [Citrobacter freundii]WFZ84203.1 hypothetical protein NFK79_19120 [Citrobacter freundii]
MSYYKIIMVTIVLVFLSPLLIPWPDKLEYRESDLFDYYFYTDVDIKQAPRISSNYYFEYISPEGSTQETSLIIFRGGDAGIIRNYLTGLGFYLYDYSGNGREERWISNDNHRFTFSIVINKKKGLVSLVKEKR